MPVTVRIREPAKWKPPECGVVKINVDGATFKEECSVGIGVIIRDSNGQVMLSCFENLPASPVAEFAEAIAIVKGLSIALDAGFRRVQLEGDAKAILDDIRSGLESCAPHGHLIDDARKLMQFFELISFNFVHREANRVAHILALLAKRSSDTQIWMEDAPSQCYSELISDCNFASS